MSLFKSPAELWTHLLKPDAIIHNPYEKTSLRLNADGFPEHLVQSKIETKKWVPCLPPTYYRCWGPL